MTTSGDQRDQGQLPRAAGPLTPPAYEGPFTVNRSLILNRRRRVVENDEYAAFLGRVIRAYSRRVAAGDIEAVADMTALADQLGAAIQDAISDLRAIGYSWADIARPLHITRQAAQQRWGSADRESEPEA